MNKKQAIANKISKIREEFDNMDPLMVAVKAIHSVGVKGDYVSEEDLEHQRTSQDRFCRLVTPTKDVSYRKFDVAGIESEYSIPDFPHDKKHIIMYCHGGGYTCGNLNYARILSGKLSLSCGIEVISFAYRLSPENPYPAAIEDALSVWDYLMHLGYGASDIIIAGDSAGGNLALELCLRLKDAGRMLPGGLILFSPWTDMTMSGKSYTVWKDKDPMLTPEYILAVRGAYAGAEADFENPVYSPLFGDLSELPPTLIQVGSNEILRDDSELLADKLQQEGVFVRNEVYEGGWHVFQMLPLGISSRAMSSAAEFVDLLIR